MFSTVCVMKGFENVCLSDGDITEFRNDDSSKECKKEKGSGINAE